MTAGLTKKQMEIRAFPFTHNYDILICNGAVRSGKTSIMSVTFLDWAMRNFNRTNFAICSKTVSACYRNVIRPLLGLAYVRKRYAITLNRSEDFFTVRCGDRENIFYIFGGKDESSQALIQGITLGGVLLDEAALMPESFVNQATARCSVEGALIFMSCNPAGGPKHWFFLNWIAKAKEKKALVLNFSLEDNPSLSESTIERYKRLYTGVFYLRYIKGEWVAAEGAIYRPFVDKPDRFLLDAPPPVSCAVIGVDFGGGTSAHAFSCVGYTPGMRKLVVLDEWYCKDALDPERLASAFVDFVRACQSRWLVADAYCDSAEQTLIRGLRTAAARARLGINIVGALKRPINDRIRTLCILMASDRFGVVKTCAHTIDALHSAVWDSRNPTQDVRLDDGSINIDSLDAMEYAYERQIPALIDRGLTA